jgi:hypothetical protein
LMILGLLSAAFVHSSVPSCSRLRAVLQHWWALCISWLTQQQRLQQLSCLGRPPDEHALQQHTQKTSTTM